MLGFTKALALESANRGIAVNAVAPGYTDTEMLAAVPDAVMERILQQVPIGRLVTAEEIAACVAFLVSDEAGFITGSTISANGGLYMT
jgi:acetoacetyl-CoA reductase